MSKVVILSGAGISAESGISTFRDSGGLWEEYKIEEICTAGCMQTNRDKTIEFYDKRRLDLKDKKPNHAHLVIKELQARYPNDISIITQNVDDLFEKAGCQDVMHLHGFLPEIRCQECHSIYNIGYQKQNEAMSQCSKCQGSLRPNIVFFGEMAPKYRDMYQELQDCMMLVVIGTSGNVIDTDMFLSPYFKKEPIRYSILNNLEPSSAIDDSLYTKVLYKKATEAIDEIAKDIDEFLD
jgi:NAD-dependent deacetylase